MKTSCSLEFLFLLILWLTLKLCHASIPVSEDGIQLAYIHSLHDLSLKIQADQALSQQHLARIRAMEEGSKAVALAMGQLDALVKHGQLLVQGTGGTSQEVSTGDLKYDGSTFSGGNYQFIDNLMGQNGPIALDRLMPSTLIPLTGELLQQAQQKVTSFTHSASSSLVAATTGALVGSLSGGLSNGSSASQAFGGILQGEGPFGMMGDGVFLRPYLGAIDDAYQTLVSQGTPTQVMQFFADPTLGGGGYQAVLGSTTIPGLSSLDLDNLFSAGASQAYQNYLQGNSSAGSNPYQGYASQLLPQLATMMNGAVPGDQLIPSLQQIGVAQEGGIPAGSSGAFPSLFSNSPLSSWSVDGSSFGLGNSTSGQQAVAVVTPPAIEAQVYQRKISDSDQRLKEISQELKTQQQAQAYLGKVLQSLIQIQQEAQNLQTSLNTTDPDSIPELTLMIRDLQGDLESRQRDSASLSLGIEGLRQQLHAELTNRAAIVEQEKQEESVHAIPRWRSSMADN